MDWTYLFYEKDEIVVSGLRTREAFPLPGDVVVLVDQGTAQQRQAFMDRLAARLFDEPELFHHILYRLDLQPLAKKALYYLDEDALQDMLGGLQALEHGPVLPTNSADLGPTEKKILLKLLEDLSNALESRGRALYVPVWETLTNDAGGATDEYLGRIMGGERYIYPTIGDGRINILGTKAGTYGNEFANASPMVNRLREILEELRPSTGSLRIRLTGLPVMLHDERTTVADDGSRSTLVSLVLVALVFAWGFGELKRPVLAVIALCCGMAWTIGLTTITIGHLNFISVTLTTMLMGVGIDFGIHFLFRFDEEMGLGCSPEQAIERTLAGTGIDTLVGAAATAAAFLALTQAHFRGISDFGIIAAEGTFLCFLSTITVLPALLAVFPGKPRQVTPSAEVAWLENQLLARARWVVLGWLLLALVACFYATRVGFDYNLLEVQAQEISTVRTELEMIRETKSTVLSAESLEPDLDHARETYEQYLALPAVARVGSLVPLLPVVSAKKQKLVQEITALVHHMRLPERLELETAEDLIALQARLEENQVADSLPQNDRAIAKAVSDLQASLERMDPGPIQDGLKAFQEDVHSDLSGTLRFLRRQEAVAPRLEDLPAELRLRYIGLHGEVRQSIQPLKNIWHRDNLEEFLSQVKSVDSTVMGHPVIQEQILSAFRRTLDKTPPFTLFGVLLVFLVYLRTVRAVVLSLLPACLAVLMIFATMGFLGLNFNVVNFVGLPISVGLGAVYGVHSLHRMRELDSENVLTSSTGPALLLSGVTDIVGFASLMTAQHRGISSLGLVISVGIGVSFLSSLLLLPALRRVSHSWRNTASTASQSNIKEKPE